MQLGEYTIVRKIAEGGMGEIFLASRSGVGGFAKQVAIKRITPRLAKESTYVEMFLREARIAAVLDHPNVVQIHELLAEEGEYCIVMEYVPGLSLSRCIKAHEGPLPLPVALQVAAQVAAGLQFVHDKRDDAGEPMKLIHRDVSPPNILLSTWGGVKITDFGIAKFRVASVLSQAGVIKGKFSYLSPEQVQGRPIDHRSDIYSLGLVLYEMTVGRRAYAGDDLRVLTAVEHGKFSPPEAVVADYPKDLRAVVMRALESDPEDRYPCCTEMQRDLMALLGKRGHAGTTVHVASFLRDLVGEGDSDIEEASAPGRLHERIEEASMPSILRKRGESTDVIRLREQRRRNQKVKVATIAAMVLVAVGLVVLLARLNRAPAEGQVERHPDERISPVGMPVGVEPRPIPGSGQTRPGQLALERPTPKMVEAATGSAGQEPQPPAQPEPAPKSGLTAKDQRLGQRRTRYVSRRGRAVAPKKSHRDGTRVVGLIAEPAVVVYLGRKRLGQTPLKLELPRRRLKLRLVNRQLGIAAHRVIEAGDVGHRVHIRIGKGRLAFHMKPGLYVQLNGKMLGRSPLPATPVFEGQHTVTIIDPFRYDKRSVKVVVRAGQTTKVTR